MLLHAPTYLTNRSVRSLWASSLWRSGGRSAEIEPLIPSPGLARFWSIPDKRNNAIIPVFFDASLNFYFLFFTLSLSLSLLVLQQLVPLQLYPWCVSVRSEKVYAGQVLLNLNATTTKSNIQRGQLSSVSYSKEWFCLLFWFRSVPQPVFILSAKRTATSVVWPWFATITREYNRLIFRALCSFPSLSRVIEELTY